MPTGYTYPVKENENLSFDEFIWSCARAFGALMHMRDDSSDQEIRLPEQSEYHKDRIKEAKERLARLEKMTLAEAKIEADKDHSRLIQSA